MREFFALYIDTLLKEKRSKSLYFLIAVNAFFLFLAHILLSYFKEHVLTATGVDGVTNIVVKMFFYFLSLWAVFVSIRVGGTAVKSDINGSIAGQILSFPISRFQYLLSRLAGAWSIVVIFYFINLVATILLLSMSAGTVLEIGSLFLGFFVSLIPLFGLVLFSCFGSLFFGTFQNIVLVVIFYLFSSSCVATVSKVGLSVMWATEGLWAKISSIGYLIFPRLQHWIEYSDSIALGRDVSFSFWAETGHLVFITAFWLFIFKLLFEKREI